MVTVESKKQSINNFGKWGWSIIIYAFICYMISSISTTDGLNIYPGAFAELHGWDANQIISISTVAGWIGVIGMVIFNQLVAKKGTRLVTTISVVILGFDLILFALTSNFALFALSIVIANFIAGTVLLNAAPGNLINKWFPKKKSIAFGWATMGMPFTSLALLPLFQFGFSKIGAPNTYLIFGIFVIIFGIATWFWIRNAPEEIGLLPDNEPVNPNDKITSEMEAEGIKKAEKEWTIKNLLKNRNTWCIGIGQGLQWLAIVGIVSQLIPRFVAECGYSVERATLMLSVAAALGILGSYFWGWLDLKISTKRACIWYGVWFVLALVLLILPPNEPINWISIIIVGIGIGGIGNLIPSMMGTCFGRHGYILSSRVISPINTIVRSCAFMLVGIVLSATGAYRFTYIVLLAVNIIGTVIVMFIKVPKGLDQEDTEKNHAGTQTPAK